MNKKPIAIQIQGKPLEEQVLTCELCGKTAKWPEVDIYCGGPFSKLCKDCDKTVCKVIERYLSYLSELPFSVVAGTVFKHSNRRRR